MTALASLAEAIAKAGLIKPGKRPLLHRVGFLLSTGKNDRKAAIGRYLESRKRGKGFGPRGRRRARTGTYSGVYATGVNKSENSMDAITTLYAEIEKARGGPRSGMIPYGSRHQWGRARFFEARAKRNGEKLSPRAQRAKGYLAQRIRGGKTPNGATRRAFYKSAELPMTDAVDELYTAIEKAKGLMPRGGSSKMARRFNPRDLLRRGGRSAKGTNGWTVNARQYLSERKKGGAWRTWNADGSGKMRRDGKYK